MVIDLWARLHPLFKTTGEQQPEIIVDSLTAESTRQILSYLLHNSRELQTALYPFFSDTRVMVNSPNEVIEKLASGQLSGGFLIEPLFDGFKMPMLGVFSDEPGILCIDYEPGHQWNPVALIALFELFRLIKKMDKNATIHLSRQYFDRKWQRQFIAILKEYLHEK